MNLQSIVSKCGTNLPQNIFHVYSFEMPMNSSTLVHMHDSIIFFHLKKNLRQYIKQLHFYWNKQTDRNKITFVYIKYGPFQYNSNFYTDIYYIYGSSRELFRQLTFKSNMYICIHIVSNKLITKQKYATKDFFYVNYFFFFRYNLFNKNKAIIIIYIY